MGKKKKKKLKKRFIKQRLQALEQQGLKTASKVKPVPVTDFVKKEKKEIKSEPKEETKKEKDYIKKDIRKVSIIIGVFIVIFVILIIVNSRTNLLSQTADKIFSVLNIG
jgi:uncharacterized membrane protein YkgB